MSNIEVEIRSFPTQEQYERLLSFFRAECGTDAGDSQETCSYDATGVDLRIIQGADFSKICLKKGDLHDEAREEIEVRCSRGDSCKLQMIFASLGFKPKVKWYRTRHTFRWKGVTATLDDIRGFGYVLELEILAEGDEEATLRVLRERLSQLGIAEASKEEIKERFSHYAQHWQELTERHEDQAR